MSKEVKPKKTLDENSDDWGPPTFLSILKHYDYLKQSITGIRMYLLIKLNNN